MVDDFFVKVLLPSLLGGILTRYGNPYELVQRDDRGSWRLLMWITMADSHTHRNGVQLLPSNQRGEHPQRWFLDMCDRFFATWFATSRPINCAWNMNWKSSAGSGGVSIPLENHHFLNYLFLWAMASDDLHQNFSHSDQRKAQSPS